MMYTTTELKTILESAYGKVCERASQYGVTKSLSTVCVHYPTQHEKYKDTSKFCFADGDEYVFLCHSEGRSKDASIEYSTTNADEIVFYALYYDIYHMAYEYVEREYELKQRRRAMHSFVFELYSCINEKAMKMAADDIMKQITELPYCAEYGWVTNLPALEHLWYKNNINKTYRYL